MCASQFIGNVPSDSYLVVTWLAKPHTDRFLTRIDQSFRLVVTDSGCPSPGLGAPEPVGQAQFPASLYKQRLTLCISTKSQLHLFIILDLSQS